MFKIGRKKKKIFGRHKCPTLVLCCKAVVGNCIFEIYVVSNNSGFCSIVVQFWPLPLHKSSLIPPKSLWLSRHARPWVILAVCLGTFSHWNIYHLPNSIFKSTQLNSPLICPSILLRSGFFWNKITIFFPHHPPHVFIFQY